MFMSSHRDLESALDEDRRDASGPAVGPAPFGGSHFARLLLGSGETKGESTPWKWFAGSECSATKPMARNEHAAVFASVDGRQR